MTQRVRHELGTPFPWGAADDWLVLVTDGATPRGYSRLADAGPSASARLTALALDAHAALEQRRADLASALGRRMGASHAVADPLTVTVVVCTRRRPREAARAVEALTRLRPAAHEIVVVDSDPGADDVRAVAERAGARYLREDRRGLNRARSRGLATATGQIVAFTDDDCLVPGHWLAPLPAAFADPTVGAVTGPAFAREVRTHAQFQRERLAGFVHRLDRRRFDWTCLRPVNAGAIGAGANMAFRRDLLAEIGDPFPPELDAGTATLSGGDLYAIYRVLAAGRGVVHDGAFWALHDHPASDEALHATLTAYGTGFSAFLTKVLLEHRELAAVTGWCWLVGRNVDAVAHELAYPEPGASALWLRYLRGSLRGAGAWLATREPASREVLAAPPRPQPAPPAQVAVVAVDGAAERNRHAAAATEPLLVFLPAATPDPGALARRHALAHERHGRPAVVVGIEAAGPAGGSLTRQFAAMRAGRRAAAARHLLTTTPLDAGAGSLSIARERFGELGGFPEQLGDEAAAQALAFAAQGAGVDLVVEPAAETDARLPDSLADAVAAAYRRGADRARLAASHPEVEATVEPDGAATTPAVRTALVLVAGAFEAARARGLWLRCARAVERGAFTAGWLDAGGPRHPSRGGVRIELDRDHAIELAGRLPQPVELWAHDRLLHRLLPREGRWDARLARDIADALGEDELAQVVAARGDGPADGPLDGCAVVLPVGSPRGEEFAAAGASVTASAGAGGHWERADRAIRAAAAARVAVPFPGVDVTPEWLRTAAAPLTGERVAAVVGAGLADGALPRPTVLADRRHVRTAYPVLGRPAQFVVVDRRAYLEAGGFKGEGHVAVLDLLERLLDAGRVVAHQDARGLTPPGTVRPLRTRNEWERWRARGELTGRDARERGPAGGLSWIAGHGLLPQVLLATAALRSRSEPSLRHLAGSTAAFAVGLATGLRRAR